MHQLESLRDGRTHMGCAIDMYETEHELIIKIQVAGVSPEDLAVQLDEHTLHVRGISEHDQEIHERAYYLRELGSGYFERTVDLPRAIDKSKATIMYKDGVLRITAPFMQQETGQS